jgi:hypothetical protein
MTRLSLWQPDEADGWSADLDVIELHVATDPYGWTVHSVDNLLHVGVGKTREECEQQAIECARSVLRAALAKLESES